MFIAHDSNNYAAGGRLYMLAVKGQANFDFGGGLLDL
jgi:hypothetical protein